MGLPVDLEVRPESGGSVIPIPLSSTGAEGKAQVWAVRTDAGASLLKADSQTNVTTVGGAALTIPYFETSSLRDAAIATPVNGMLIANAQVGSLQARIGDEWVTIGVV